MGKGRISKIEKELINFKNKLKPLPVKRLIFFGSRAKGKAHAYSDIDLIVVSPIFKKLNFLQRSAKMYNYWMLDMPVDFLCYTPEEFKRKAKEISIVRAAIKEGKKII